MMRFLDLSHRLEPGMPTSGFRFCAVPPAIVGGTSFSVRAFAL